MKRFKVGDRVIVTKGRSHCSVVCNGEIRTIKELCKGDGEEHAEAAILDCAHGSGVWCEELTHVFKNIPITETEFLDAFRDNFKDGV